MRRLPENLAQGQAGVYSVAAQLLLRGHNPFFPAVDIGADLILDSGVKIQVKSTHLTFKTVYKQGAYAFKLATRAVVNKGAVQKRIARIFSQECDFVVLWGIEQNRFWVVPAATFDGHHGVVVGPDSSWKDADVEALKRAREEGKTYRQIAQDHNLNVATVHTTVSGARTMSDRTSLTREVRLYEGRWDLIDSCVATMTEVEVVSDLAMSDVRK